MYFKVFPKYYKVIQNIATYSKVIQNIPTSCRANPKYLWKNCKCRNNAVMLGASYRSFCRCRVRVLVLCKGWWKTSMIRLRISLRRALPFPARRFLVWRTSIPGNQSATMNDDKYSSGSTPLFR